MKYIYKILPVAVLLLLNTMQLFAQTDPGEPANCDDIDDCPIPLDNYLIILVVAGLAFTTWYLHTKQKKEAIA